MEDSEGDAPTNYIMRTGPGTADPCSPTHGLIGEKLADIYEWPRRTPGKVPTTTRVLAPSILKVSNLVALKSATNLKSLPGSQVV